VSASEAALLPASPGAGETAWVDVRRPAAAARLLLPVCNIPGGLFFRACLWRPPRWDLDVSATRSSSSSSCWSTADLSSTADLLTHKQIYDTIWDASLVQFSSVNYYYYYYLFITPLRQHSKIQAHRTQTSRTIKIYRIKLQICTQWCHKRLCLTVTASFILSLVDVGLTPYLSSSSSSV